MGYCSRIYIVRKSKNDHMIDEETGKRYAEEIAMFNLEKITWELQDAFDLMPATDCYIYADDGNTMILEDCYGEPLREMSIEWLINALHEELWRRRGTVYANTLCWMHDVLTSIYLHGPSDYVCLHYGY